jgi:hypothetical protein
MIWLNKNWKKLLGKITQQKYVKYFCCLSFIWYERKAFRRDICLLSYHIKDKQANLTRL